MVESWRFQQWQSQYQSFLGKGDRIFGKGHTHAFFSRKAFQSLSLLCCLLAFTLSIPEHPQLCFKLVKLNLVTSLPASLITFQMPHNLWVTSCFLGSPWSCDNPTKKERECKGPNKNFIPPSSSFFSPSPLASSSSETKCFCVSLSWNIYPDLLFPNVKRVKWLVVWTFIVYFLQTIVW